MIRKEKGTMRKERRKYKERGIIVIMSFFGELPKDIVRMMETYISPNITVYHGLASEYVRKKPQEEKPHRPYVGAVGATGPVGPTGSQGCVGSMGPSGPPQYISSFLVESPELEFSIELRYSSGDFLSYYGVGTVLKTLLGDIKDGYSKSVNISWNNTISWNGYYFTVNGITIKGQLAEKFHQWLKDVMNVFPVESPISQV